MALNAGWHRAHPMPRHASDADRLRWHEAHQLGCGCRPIPAKLLALAAAKPGAKAPASAKAAVTARPAAGKRSPKAAAAKGRVRAE